MEWQVTVIITVFEEKSKLPAWAVSGVRDVGEVVSVDRAAGREGLDWARRVCPCGVYAPVSGNLPMSLPPHSAFV